MLILLLAVLHSQTPALHYDQDNTPRLRLRQDRLSIYYDLLFDYYYFLVNIHFEFSEK